MSHARDAILQAVFSSASWPASAGELESLQRRLALARPRTWRPPGSVYAIGGCFICFGRDGERGTRAERAFAAAALAQGARIAGRALARGTVTAAYEPGLLALREGPLLETAVRSLPQPPEVLLVNATGADHPRRAGLALHLGAALELPTVGLTHRPLLAAGEWPAREVGASSPLELDGDTVACWLRTRAHARPLAVHPAWRTELDTACEVVLAGLGGVRAPEPLREARRLARRARARATSDC